MPRTFLIDIPEVFLQQLDPRLMVTSVHLQHQNMTVKTLIARGADPYFEDDEGRTPLMIAVEKNNIPLIEEFINCGVDLNYVSRTKGSALHYAANISNLDTIKFLLENGADVNSIDSMDNTPLHNAALLGRLDVIDAFLEVGASIESQNSRGLSPLDAAASSGSIDVFELFVQKGVDLHPSQNNLLRLLNIAVECKHDTLALWLLKKEADGTGTPKKQILSRYLPASISLCISMCFCACLPLLMY